MTSLLLVIIVEPGSALLNDVLGFDFGIAILYVTLGVAGLALILIRYSLRSAATSSGRAESASEMATWTGPPPGGAWNVSRC